jgi:hypothetical protein
MWQSRSKAIVPLILALAGFGCGSEEPQPSTPPAAAPAPAPPRAAPAPAPAPAAGAVVPAPPGEVIEWKGDLPSDFPGDVPQYPDSKVTSVQGTNELGLAVTFDSADTVESVAKFYADSLAAMGWQTQTQQSGEGTMVLADKEDKMLQALIHAGGQGTVVEMIVAPAQ